MHRSHDCISFQFYGFDDGCHLAGSEVIAVKSELQRIGSFDIESILSALCGSEVYEVVFIAVTDKAHIFSDQNGITVSNDGGLG